MFETPNPEPDHLNLHASAVPRRSNRGACHPRLCPMRMPEISTTSPHGAESSRDDGGKAGRLGGEERRVVVSRLGTRAR